MKVLVTGGSGFIGKHVVARALKERYSVRVLTRPGRETGTVPAPPGVEIAEHDLRERKGLTGAVRGVDAVIHCAAAMGGDADEQEAVTVDGTTHLLSAMAEAEVRHIVVISTFAVYDYTTLPRGSVLNEDTPLEEEFDLRSPYVWAKRKQEDLVRAVAEASSWRWTVLRPGIVYGPERTWFYHLGAQPSPKRWVSYAGSALFPVTYVENLADAIVLATEAEGAAGATLNIVDDGLPTRRLYMETIARLTGQSPTIMDIPWEMLDPVSRAATWVNRRVFLRRVPVPDLLRSERLQARCKPLAYSNERAKATLGWVPRHSFLDGMQRSFAHLGGSPASAGASATRPKGPSSGA